jgi:segregation and condensation protein A
MEQPNQEFHFQSTPEDTVEYVRKDKERVLKLCISQWLRTMEQKWLETGFDSEEASAWMVLLAILLEWKMQLLLPKPIVEVEEEPYDREAHMDEYRLIQKTARKLSELADERAFWLSRETDDQTLGVEPQDRLRQTGLFDLLQAFQRVLATEEIEEPDEIIPVEEYDLEHQMSYVMTRVGQFQGRILFQQLFRPGSSRNLLVATFLALLELVRLHQLQIEQTRSYGELWIGVMPIESGESTESSDFLESVPSRKRRRTD